MSERKVLNKYYPPDFDPSKIPRLRLPKERQYTVRLMAPCNMRCTTCGEYIYKGKKFNARKETVQNEEYLGLKIYRFYIKCPRCLAEITFKTDPENADYIVEHGATRNFQALKLAEEAAEKEAREKEEEEKNNPMKLLENRTKASKMEMESLEALEEIRDLNQRHAKVDFEHLLKQNYEKLLDEQKRQEEEDEAFIRSTFLTADGEKVKRINDDSHDISLKLGNKRDAKDCAPTDVLCDDDSDAAASLPKKQKMQNGESMSSRQKNIEMLRKAVKVKKASTGSDSKVSAQSSEGTIKPSESKVDSSSTEACKNIKDSVTESKPSGLGLLCSYSESDSDSS